MSKASRITSVCGALWIVSIVALATLAALLPLQNPLAIDLSRMLMPPSAHAWAGTDQLGRDVLSRLIFASRESLVVIAGAASLSILLGVMLGGTAGYLGGIADRMLGILIDVSWSVPFVVFIVLIVSIVGVSPLTLILSIGLLNWVSSARVFRALTASIRKQDFVRTARAYGYGRWQIAAYTVLPNLRSPLLALSAYAAVEVLTLETGLAFIGLGLPAPAPTWGSMLADGSSYFSAAWWLVAAAAIVVTATLASFQALARHFEHDLFTQTRGG
jgi:peptide/nickel transport system permease protein